MAPRAFGQLSKSKVPAKALLFSCTCLLPGIVLLYTTDSIISAFTLATTVASVLFIFVWGLIVASYLVYRRRSPEKHESSVYKMPFGVVACWAVLGFFAAMIVILAMEPDTRQALLVTPVWFVVLGIAYWLLRRRRGVGGGPGEFADEGGSVRLNPPVEADARTAEALRADRDQLVDPMP
jgi:D-serine/D-alanine/glycine transporter